MLGPRLCGGQAGNQGFGELSHLGPPHNQVGSQGPEECHQFRIVLPCAVTTTIVASSHVALVDRSGFRRKVDFGVDVRGAEAGVPWGGPGCFKSGISVESSERAMDQIIEGSRDESRRSQLAQLCRTQEPSITPILIMIDEAIDAIIRIS